MNAGGGCRAGNAERRAPRHAAKRCGTAREACYGQRTRRPKGRAPAKGATAEPAYSRSLRRAKENPPRVRRVVLFHQLEQLAERCGDLPEETALLGGAPGVVVQDLRGHALFGKGQGALQLPDLELVLQKAHVGLALRIRDLVHLVSWCAPVRPGRRRRFASAAAKRERAKSRRSADGSHRACPLTAVEQFLDRPLD